MTKRFKKRLLKELENNKQEECPDSCKEGVTCPHSSLGKIFKKLGSSLHYGNSEIYFELYVESVPFSIVILLMKHDLI